MWGARAPEPDPSLPWLPLSLIPKKVPVTLLSLQPVALMSQYPRALLAPPYPQDSDDLQDCDCCRRL